SGTGGVYNYNVTSTLLVRDESSWGLTYANFSSVEFTAPDTANTINLSNMESMSFAVHARGGNDVVNCTLAKATLTVGPTVTVDGGGGTDSLAITDSRSGHNDAFTISPTTVTATFTASPAVITYAAIESLSLTTQPG